MSLLLLFFACQEKEVMENSDIEDTSDSVAAFQYSIVMIADPHIGSTGEHAERLTQAIDWINEHKEARDIELAFVLGDIGWHDGLAYSKELLEQLEIPYAPVIGDNEVHFGDEENFGTVYGPTYQSLSETMEDWVKAGSGAVWNPEYDQNSYFYNFAFRYKGIRYITVDWASRAEDSFYGEMGDLHDFDGGSWSFFSEEIQSLSQEKKNSAIILSHIPMYFGPGSFDESEAEQVVALTENYADEIYGNFAGHFHFNSEDTFQGAGFDYYVTDATWDDEITVRMVEVWESETGFSFVQEIVAFDYEGGQ